MCRGTERIETERYVQRDGHGEKRKGLDRQKAIETTNNHRKLEISQYAFPRNNNTTQSRDRTPFS